METSHVRECSRDKGFSNGGFHLHVVTRYHCYYFLLCMPAADDKSQVELSRFLGALVKAEKIVQSGGFYNLKE